jgi:integrase
LGIRASIGVPDSKCCNRCSPSECTEYELFPIDETHFLIPSADPLEDTQTVAIPESPTLGLTHLQFEAMLTAARLSANVHDFALAAMLGLLGLRIFEGCGADIEDLGEEHGHRVLRVRGKEGKVVLAPPPGPRCRYRRRRTRPRRWNGL